MVHTRTKRKRQQKRAREELEEEDSLESFEFIETNRNIEIGEIGTPNQHDGKIVSFTFWNSFAKLRNFIQNLCQNHCSNQKKVPNTVSFTDLFFIRKDLKIILENGVIMEEEEGEEEEGEEEKWEHQAKNYEKRNFQVNYTTLPVGLSQFTEWIEQEAATQLKEIEDLKMRGYISFEGLGEIFTPGTDVVGFSVDTGASLIGYHVISAKYLCQKRGKNAYRWFQIGLQFIVSTGDQFLIIQHSDSFSQFSENVPMSSLRYHLMSPQMEAELTRRGEKYIKLSIGRHYMAYNPSSFRVHAGVKRRILSNLSMTSFLQSTGRIMCDSEIAYRLGIDKNSSFNFY